MTELELLNKYPKIFKEYHDKEQYNSQNSCMVWGLEVPESWLPIIDALCDCLQNYTYIGSGFNKYPQVVATQVKEKFGELRFYYNIEWSELESPSYEAMTRIDNHIQGKIDMAECLINSLKKYTISEI